MNPFGWIESTWWLGIPTALLLGALLGANPAALPILGTAAGLGSAGALAARGGAIKVAAAFGAGMVVVYTAVGVVAARIDDLTESVLRPYAGIGYLVLGVLVASLALFLLLRPSSFCSACALPARKNVTMLGAFLAGVPAGLVNCPACSGVVLGVAASAASFGNAIYSTAVMLALGVGHAGVLVGFVWFLTKGWSLPEYKLRIAQRVTAVFLLGVAAYFFYLSSIQGLRPGFRLV